MEETRAKNIEGTIMERTIGMVCDICGKTCETDEDIKKFSYVDDGSDDGYYLCEHCFFHWDIYNEEETKC